MRKLPLVSNGAAFVAPLVIIAALSGCQSAGTALTANLNQVNAAVHPMVSAPPTVWINNQSSSDLKAYTSSNTPAYSIKGSYTHLEQPQAIAADNATGDIYVADYGSYSSNEERILVFSNYANGNVAPVETLGSNAITDSYLAIALDPAEHLWVGQSSGSGFGASSILEFAKGAHGKVKPITEIEGGKSTIFYLWGIATDSSSNLYATNTPYGGQIEIAEFAAGTSGGNAPIRIISGNRTGLSNFPEGIAVDSNGYIYVANYNFGTSTIGDVEIFGPNQSGNVAPHAVLSYSGFEEPYKVALDGSNNIYVADGKAKAIFVFAPGASGNATPTRTITDGVTDVDGITICDTSNCEGYVQPGSRSRK